MASRWTPDQQTTYRNQAREAGMSDADMDEWLSRNPDDFNRLAESQIPTMHRPYDSQTGNQTEMEANRQADISSGSPLAGMWGGQGDPRRGGGGGGGSQSPAQAWNAQPAPAGGGMGQSSDLFKMLMDRATQGTTISREDPNIRQQVAPYAAQEERAKRNYISDVAEREGPLANLRGEERMAAERMGQRVGGFEAELIGRELTAKREEITHAIDAALRIGAQDQAQALTLQLAQIDADLRRQGLDVQRYGIDSGANVAISGQNNQMDQFLRELALREWGMGEDNDYRWASLL
jgi:hypothetical protein